ncbi:related to 2-3-cyclic-nucleotide 3-phosphodiesterase [Ramularia collo-cygni]|uniref:Related to 2-3-cyclic-nucleotide 3-phosphodiesterase n=1 Tax=Ramularia collo-cygni TaxID=112498 RepID=A0A2D3V3Z1_9PEZI|nr:related to 2-3-cyclic-nucleotide 3-phosphodiesterase [Ramularia collo-cygni]CZT19397.1 related to 2-3-cyclic-nucleotide 3-phosphodiesterase [Ramularia collo-cygni]
MSQLSPTSGEVKPIIVGLFGLPGSGKSTAKKHLQQSAFASQINTFEGSEVLENIAKEGGTAFRSLDEGEKISLRKKAIAAISKQCADSNRIGIVTGHFMFWREGEDAPETVLTQQDWRVFTHILYLNLPVAKIQQQIQEDDQRKDRPRESLMHLQRWQVAERDGLRSSCLDNNVKFCETTADSNVLAQTIEFLNQICVEARLDGVVNTHDPSKLRTVLLLDGDKTIIPGDTGEAFWKLHDNSSPLKEIFEAGYSYDTFREAMNLYRTVSSKAFDKASREVAESALMHQQFLDLLNDVGKHEHIGAIVVTCGSRSIWEKVLSAAGVSEKVKIIGCEVDGMIVTPELKGILVNRLHDVHKKFVWAFGDSPLDLPMLRNADQAIVIVGEKGARSRSMEGKLGDAIRNGLQVRQLLMQVCKDGPLLDTDQLPLVQLDDVDFKQSILKTPHRLEYLDATDRVSAKLLMSATRDAKCRGPALVDAHRLVGRYLATEYLGAILGLETYKIMHVQGGEVDGHRLSSEDKTVIVPLMRGGEPMARGVWEAFPTAMYVHAKEPVDLHKSDHIAGRAAIVLVDGVVNTGKSVVDYVQHIRSCDANVKIVVLAGVVQGQAVEKGGVLDRLSNRYEGISLIALRISANKYTGSGSTDTGHRLFNTTHMN